MWRSAIFYVKPEMGAFFELLICEHLEQVLLIPGHPLAAEREAAQYFFGVNRMARYQQASAYMLAEIVLNTKVTLKSRALSVKKKGSALKQLYSLQGDWPFSSEGPPWTSKHLVAMETSSFCLQY